MIWTDDGASSTESDRPRDRAIDALCCSVMNVFALQGNHSIRSRSLLLFLGANTTPLALL